MNSDSKKFFYFSSVKAAADTVEGILTENDKVNPVTHYGKSKIEAEEYILSQNLPEGKKVYIGVANFVRTQFLYSLSLRV